MSSLDSSISSTTTTYKAPNQPKAKENSLQIATSSCPCFVVTSAVALGRMEVLLYPSISPRPEKP